MPQLYVLISPSKTADVPGQLRERLLNMPELQRHNFKQKPSFDDSKQTSLRTLLSFVGFHDSLVANIKY